MVYIYICIYIWKTGWVRYYIYIWSYREYRGYVCMHACMHAWREGGMEGWMDVYIYIYVHNIHGGICEEYAVNIWDKSFKYERIIKQTYTVYINIYVNIYTNIYIYIQIYIYTNIYIYKYIQIHGITGDKCWTSGINAELIWIMKDGWPFWPMSSTNTGDFTVGRSGKTCSSSPWKTSIFS